MATNRIKLTETVITKLRAEEILGEVATLKLEERDLKNEMDRELTAVREKFEGSLTRVGDEIARRVPLLESWLAANPDELPKGRKSLDLLHGTIGYRTGNPKLKTLKGWTWDRVLEKIKSIPTLALFIRTKEEVNKEAIISAVQEARLLPKEAAQLGCQVVQDEAFFVEPKLEDLEARTGKAVTA